MKTILIALMLPVFCYCQSDKALKVGPGVWRDTNGIVNGDTIEATIFMNNIGVPVTTGSEHKAAFPIVGYVVVVDLPRRRLENGTYIIAEFPERRVICYLDHRKRLILTRDVWDYKIREKN